MATHWCGCIFQLWFSCFALKKVYCLLFFWKLVYLFKFIKMHPKEKRGAAIIYSNGSSIQMIPTVQWNLIFSKNIIKMHSILNKYTLTIRIPDKSWLSKDPVLEGVDFKISKTGYSNPLNIGLFWFSNGRFVSGCLIFEWWSEKLKKAQKSLKKPICGPKCPVFE